MTIDLSPLTANKPANEAGHESTLNINQLALLETSNRAKLGILVYPMLWAVVAYACGLRESDPSLMAFASALFVLNSLLRLAHAARLPALVRSHYQLAQASFIFLVLWNGAQWGILCVLCIYDPSLTAMKVPMIISGTGILAGGTIIMSINPIVRIAFPVLSVAPVVFALAQQEGTQDLLLALLSIIFIGYVIGASGIVHNDYWNAARAGELLKQRASELEELSVTDTLTRLHNRLYFNVQFDGEWKRACRHHHPIAVMLIDLDNFKRINDNYGHTFGDYCLQQAAAVMKSVNRSGDIVARYGGEEFVIALPATTLEQAEYVADRLLARLRDLKVEYLGKHLPITASIGIAAAVPELPDECFRLIHHADEALYRAKHEGRDRYSVYQN
jgi:diguanylate cyclase (GGDEF)-like protein